MLRRTCVALSALAIYAQGKVMDVTDTLPSSPVPFVVRHMEGPKVLLADDVFRRLTDVKTTATGQANSSAAGFSMLLSNGKPNQAVPPHYHVHWHETFLPMTGQMRVWVNGKPRDLIAGDFAMVPGYNNHSYQFIAQETEFMGLIQPAGFDDFFTNISSPWSPRYNVPFPPDQPKPFPGATFAAVAQSYDVQRINASISAAEGVWGEPTGGQDWHESNGTLPNDAKTPYFLPNGAGPHHWLESAGAVISPLATAVQTAGNFTIAQVSLRKSDQHSLGNQTHWVSADHQFFYGMRGEVMVGVAGEQIRIITGDSLFVPAGTNVTISSSVNYSKFLFCSGGPNGIDSQMIQSGKSWAYSTPPAH